VGGFFLNKFNIFTLVSSSDSKDKEKQQEIMLVREEHKVFLYRLLLDLNTFPLLLSFVVFIDCK